MIDPKIIFGRVGNHMFQGAYIYAQACENRVPDIYVQDYRLFHKYREGIRKLYGKDVYPNSIPKVAIHVRRAANPINPEEPKYSENPFYVNLWETGYYQEAMALFPDAKFLVFSDDIPWCKEQEIFKDCEFSVGTEIEDLNRMASCQGIIMANSSFSWWAAYLSKARVVAPSYQRWYTDGDSNRTKLLDEWQKI